MTKGQGNSRKFVTSFVLVCFITCSLVITEPAAQAQRRRRVPRPVADTPAMLGVGDRTVHSIVREINARNIENTIRRLVSFGTRNTLSVQDNPTRGIGAARDWLFSEFSKAAEQSGGRMTVVKQTFEQPKAARVPEPIMVT